MPYYPRKRVYKKRAVAGGVKRRFTRKPRTTTMVARPPREKVYTFEKTTTFYLSGGTFNANGNQVAIAHQLNALPEYTSFTTLFDSYRIAKLHLVARPNVSSTDAGNLNPASAGILRQPVCSAIDNDDDSLTSFTNLQNYPPGVMKMCMTDDTWEHTWVPKAATRIYNNLLADGFAQQGGWLDCAQPAVPWYGIKWATNGVVDNDYGWWVTVTYTMQFKGSR